MTPELQVLVCREEKLIYLIKIKKVVINERKWKYDKFREQVREQE